MSKPLKSMWRWTMMTRVPRRRVPLRSRFNLKMFGASFSRLVEEGIRPWYSILPLQPLPRPINCGTDRSQKLIQYSMNVYLFFHRAVSRRMPIQGTERRPFEVELLHRLESTTSGLSMARCVPTLCMSIGVLTPSRLLQEMSYHVQLVDTRDIYSR